MVLSGGKYVIREHNDEAILRSLRMIRVGRVEHEQCMLRCEERREERRMGQPGCTTAYGNLWD